jgi:hypothetical protein
LGQMVGRCDIHEHQMVKCPLHGRNIFEYNGGCVSVVVVPSQNCLIFKIRSELKNLRSPKRLRSSGPQRGENSAIWLWMWPFGLEAGFKPVPSRAILWSSFLMSFTRILSVKFCVSFQNCQNAKLFFSLRWNKILSLLLSKVVDYRIRAAWTLN